MADEKKQRIKEPLQNEFEGLPLDEKIANLFKMEVVTLSESFNYAVQNPLKVVEKVGDVISEVGTKIEAEARKAWHTAESKTHPPTGAKEAKKDAAPKPKGGGRKNPPKTA